MNVHKRKECYEYKIYFLYEVQKYLCSVADFIYETVQYKLYSKVNLKILRVPKLNVQAINSAKKVTCLY